MTYDILEDFLQKINEEDQWSGWRCFEGDNVDLDGYISRDKLRKILESLKK